MTYKNGCNISQNVKESCGESPKKKKGTTTNEGCSKRRIKSHFPFLQSPCSSRSSRSRSQSTLGERESSSPSDFGEGKKEKDKSHKRKSHLNRAFTDEPVPPPEQPSSFHLPPSPKTKIKMGMSESGGTKKGTPICKVPPIPSILTSTTSNERGRGTNRKESSANGTSTVDNSISRSKQLPPSPTRTNTNILNKLQTFESSKNNKTIPSAVVVNKRDSFSDAEGVSFIKKLLQKESLAEKTVNEVKQSTNASFILKKSSSAGSTNSKYWSKFTSSQPILKKFFEKPEKSLDENKNNQQLLNNNEQENGKHLHANTTSTTITTTTDDDDDDGVVAQIEEEEKVISYSVAQKASFFMKLEHEQRFSKWRKNSLDASSSSPIPNSITTKINSATADASNTNEMRSNNRQQFSMNVATAANNSKINNETDSEMHNEQTNEQEDCHLSLKDRVHMFDKLIAVGGKTPSTPHHGVTSAGFVPVTHSSSAVYTQGISQVSETNQQAKTRQQIGPLYQQRRAGSGTDLQTCYPLPTFKAEISSNNTKRNHKTRSLYVNNDDLSEDGEVSSGGQEVAEIISRSYENSPVARKKYWKNQKQTQSTFTKEIWRKCKVNDNTSSSQTYKVTTTNVTHNNTAIIKDKICDKSSIPSGIIDVNVNPNSNPETPPTTTSNLLQILSALSSSSNEEELEENGKTKSRSTFEQSQEPTTQGNISNLNSSSSKVVVVGTHQVYIPQPDDESFQLFFGKASTSDTSISIPHNNNNNNDSRGEGGERFINLSNQSNDPEMNIVQRESDLLVMKKNVPLVRRKSSGKSRRNPLKALAARMDLHDQWYTEEDNNGETNNSDGDKETL